jgi:exosortase/archaeosortase family protein
MRLEAALPALLSWLLAIALFWKALAWLIQTTVLREQVMHAAIVLGFGLVFLLTDRGQHLRWSLTFGPRAVGFFVAACAAAGAAMLFRQPIFMLAGLGLLAGAVLLFVLGEAVFRPALGFSLGFAGFTILSVLFPLADWPLRLLAGKSAAWFLSWIGDPVELGFTAEPVRLILVSQGRPFEVATECNGFGIISGCLLLAILLAFSKRLRVMDKVLLLALSPLLGLLSNAVRILVIVKLAPMVGSHYLIMHEIVGIVLFLGTLAFLWWLVTGLPEKPCE